MQLHQSYLLPVGEILPSEGTTQGDSIATRANKLGILSLVKFLVEFININKMNAKEVVFVDDVSVAGSLNSIEDYRDKLTAIGPKCSYFPKPTKSYLIV